MQGQIYKIHSDFYYVKNADGEFVCKLKDTLKKQKEIVAVGDIVELTDDNGFIAKILNRKNFLPRPKAANIDSVLIISSLKEPELDFLQLDRYITFLIYNNIEPILCFNKEDLEVELDKVIENVNKIYKSLNFKIFFISAKNKSGLDELTCYIKGKTIALCGQSGVGKSTFLNGINTNINLKTSSVSAKTLRGTHTTRHVEIIDCDGFRVMDTPGFSNLKFDFLLPDELINYFPDIKIYSGNCKYSDCLHNSTEKGICSVVDNSDKIPVSRYQSYLTLLNECFEYKKQISKRSIKVEECKKQTGSVTLTKISKQKRASARNTDKQRIKKYGHTE